MAAPTERLGLAKPDDGSDGWGVGYRQAMDTLDAHPGLRVVNALVDVPSPWQGQTVFEIATLKNWTWSGTQWSAAAEAEGPPAFYRHVQGVPASTWTIAHNLGFYPAGVIARDSSGDLHEGRVTYIDTDTLSIAFFVSGVPASFSGEAFIS